MAVSEKQLAALQRARDAKALMSINKTSITGISPPKSKPIDNSGELSDKRIWLDALFTSIKTLQIKSAVYVRDAIPLADEILKQYKDKWDK